MVRRLRGGGLFIMTRVLGRLIYRRFWPHKCTSQSTSCLGADLLLSWIRKVNCAKTKVMVFRTNFQPRVDEKTCYYIVCCPQQNQISNTCVPVLLVELLKLLAMTAASCEYNRRFIHTQVCQVAVFCVEREMSRERAHHWFGWFWSLTITISVK